MALHLASLMFTRRTCPARTTALGWLCILLPWYFPGGRSSGFRPALEVSLWLCSALLYSNLNLTLNPRVLSPPWQCSLETFAKGYPALEFVSWKILSLNKKKRILAGDRMGFKWHGHVQRCFLRKQLCDDGTWRLLPRRRTGRRQQRNSHAGQRCSRRRLYM